MERLLTDFKTKILSCAIELNITSMAPLLLTFVDIDFLNEWREVIQQQQIAKRDLFIFHIKLIFGLYIKDPNEQRAFYSNEAGPEKDAATVVIDALVDEVMQALAEYLEVEYFSRQNIICSEVLDMFQNLYDNGNDNSDDDDNDNEGKGSRTQFCGRRKRDLSDNNKVLSNRWHAY
jgi:hypothetical protein